MATSADAIDRNYLVLLSQRQCVKPKMISVALIFYPGLGLALSECKQWRN